MNKESEPFATAVYDTLLKYFETRLGPGSTYTEQLDREAKNFLENHTWKGVFARDQDWKKHVGKGYMIVNLDTKEMKGSHWVAIANNLLYDSFGRTRILGPGANLRDVDRDAEQNILEDNCGQRCLAFLAVHKIYGPKVAKLL